MPARLRISILAVAAAALLALTGFSGTGGTNPTAWSATAAGQPAYAPVSLALAPTLTAPPPRVGVVGTSVMPHAELLCSVETQGTPEACSVQPGDAHRRCSAHCDSSQNCSVDGRQASPSVAGCSVFAEPRVVCTVLNPPVGQPGIFGSICSAYNADGVPSLFCSTLEPSLKKQFCSAENPGGPGNFCSTRELNNAGSRCSVLQSSTGARNFCSVAYVGQKLCSAGNDGTCSISIHGNGRCSTFRGAVSGLCSAFGANAHCSVIGGPAGLQCAQP